MKTYWLCSEVAFSEENIFRIIMASKIYLKLIIVSCKGHYWNHYCSSFIEVTSILHVIRKNVVFADDTIYLLQMEI